MRKMIDSLRADMAREVTVTGRELTLCVAVGALAGTVLGMLISPPKYRMVGCNNGPRGAFPPPEDEADTPDDAEA